MAAIRIAVISDQHYFTKQMGTPPSHVRLTADVAELRCPIKDLRKLISDQSIEADILACPGDITYQADMPAVDLAWRDLVEFKQQLKAKHLIAATGNHDLVSRLDGTPESNEPVEHLKMLEPPYPAATNDDDRVKYFGSHVLRVDSSLCRLVSVNSCHDHGTGQSSMYERGAFSPSMARSLAKVIGSEWSEEVGVLVCHHHPMLHSKSGLGTYDVMKGGDQLLDILERTGPWLVIHGHKHYAQIQYAPGGGASPVVFSAGSLSFVNRQSGGGMSNQFYLIEVEAKRGNLAGRVRAWSWTTTTGWSPSSQTEELPDDARFGCRRAPEAVAEEIAAYVTSDVPITWIDLTAEISDVEGLLPKDRRRLEKRLRDYHGIEIEYSHIGRPSKIGKRRS